MTPPALDGAAAQPASRAIHPILGYSSLMADFTPDMCPTAPETENDRVFAATDSPCVAVCSTLFDEICRGCGRTAMEVSNWVFMSDAEKQVVWHRIRSQGYPRR